MPPATPPNPDNPAYKQAVRLEAVTTWLALGNMKQVAAVTKVPYQSLLNWRKTPWWGEIEKEIAAGKKLAQGQKVDDIVDRALDVINDRLINGDIVVNNKTGELVRRPVSLRDVSSTTNALMQRAAILEKMRENEGTKQDTETIKEQLNNLALEFARMNKRGPTVATDIAYTELENNDDALHEERQEGL